MTTWNIKKREKIMKRLFWTKFSYSLSLLSFDGQIELSKILSFTVYPSDEEKKKVFDGLFKKKKSLISWLMFV